MTVQECRACGEAFFPEPLLAYSNMPKAAQHFPDSGALATDSGVDLTLHQCSGCGLVQLGNGPVPYYREVIRAAAVSAVIREAKTRQFSEFIQAHSLDGKRLLEIGCGRGEFLSLLGPGDMQAFGIEYSESAVAECRSRNLRVSRGYPGQDLGILPEGPFDAFLLLMFLEHMPEPNTALRSIRENLREGAVGLVEVPNFDLVLDKGLFSEFTIDHLLYFTRDTLQSTLHLNGFDVLSCRALREDYVLSAVVKKRSRLDLSSFHGDQERIRGDLGAFLDRFTGKRVAIWGAGHQALAIISMTGIAEKICYVIDSAPFKQGKYTPASHLPIVSPETLLEAPVDAIVIMAASYSDEVAGILRRRFGPNLPAVILRDFGLEAVPPGKFGSGIAPA